MTLVSLPESLEARYAEVNERVANAIRKAGRRADDVVMVAVTKSADPEQIRRLINLGHKDFGENRVQQLVQRAAIVEEYFSRLRVSPNLRRAKEAAEGGQGNLFVASPRADLLAPLASPPAADAIPTLRWHMVGHLQRNKARKIIDFVRLIHSVDSLRLAEELQAVTLKREVAVEVLLQVNFTGEGTKFGCPMPAAIPLAEQIETMVNVRLRGLMTMGPADGDEKAARMAFSRCRELLEEMKTRGIGEGRLNLLSMGMSGDFEWAIAEGANIIRVGTAIFGEGPAAPDDAREEPGESAEDAAEEDGAEEN